MIFEKHEIDEIKNCIDYPIYFIEKYVKINNINYGLIPFKLYNIQKEYINAILNHNLVLINKCRQSGSTTLNLSYALYNMIFDYDKTIFYVSNSMEQSKNLKSKFIELYNNLPEFLKPKIIKNNIYYIEFESGMKLNFTNCDINHFIGQNINLLMVEECAYFNIDKFNEIIDCIFPIIKSIKNSKIIISSTPSSIYKETKINPFYRLWSEQDNDFHKITVNWKDLNFKSFDELSKNISKFQFEIEFNNKFIEYEQFR